jgi:hypothetical protein
MIEKEIKLDSIEVRAKMSTSLIRRMCRRPETKVAERATGRKVRRKNIRGMASAEGNHGSKRQKEENQADKEGIS